MPGLDPGIHHVSQEGLSKRMDCRVKPGNDSMKTAPSGMSRGRRHISVMDASRRAAKSNFWGMTAHGLFILQCNNYLLLLEVRRSLSPRSCRCPSPTTSIFCVVCQS
jgi:hypothetical protein